MKENKPFHWKGKLRSLVPNTMRYKENIEMGLLLNFHKKTSNPNNSLLFRGKTAALSDFLTPISLTCHIK